MQLKIETIKKKRKDSELQSLKIMEMQKLLIPRKIVDQLIGDLFGRMHEMLLTKPKSIIGDIKTEIKDGTNQTLVRMLQKTYMKELKKLMENAKKRYIDAIDTKIEEIEENGKS
jgi:DNA-binding transcriptional regulator PaaX